jgi:hypothetical protein
MANALYAKGREGFLDGSIDWDTNTIKACLIDFAAYTANLATHDNLDDIPSGARFGTPQTLGSKTVTDGVADAADITVTAVGPGGTVVEAIAIWKDTGVESTSRLIALIDTLSSGAMSLTLNGGDVTVQWDNGANKIFKL